MLNSKIISAIFCVLFSFCNFQFANSYDRFAKVVFIGKQNSGKTVLYNLLTHSDKGLHDTVHTEQISHYKMEYNVDGKSVCVYFSDTSGEPKHEALMEAFCNNAHVVFVMIDALDLVRNRLRPQLLSDVRLKAKETDKDTYDKSLSELELLIGNLYKYAPDCHVVAVLTKMGNVEDEYKYEENHKWMMAKSEIEGYIKNIGAMVPKHNIECKFDLTLEDTTGKEALQKRDELENIIKRCLTKYGVENLPKDSDGFRAEVSWDYEVEKGACYGENVKSKKPKLIVH